MNGNVKPTEETSKVDPTTKDRANLDDPNAVIDLTKKRF